MHSVHSGILFGGENMLVGNQHTKTLLHISITYYCYLRISLVHSVSHLMITPHVSSSVSSSSSFPLFPLPYCAAAPSLCRNHRGSCLFTLFLGIKAVAITRCQLYGTPKTPLFPVLCRPFPRHFGLPLPSLGGFAQQRADGRAVLTSRR